MPDLIADSRELREHIGVEFEQPTVDDGAAMWRLARDTRVLDLNSSYAYLMWGRDFSRTSVLATNDGQPCGFISGYLRPDEPTTLMVWQVAVAEAMRGRGLAGQMLGHLVERLREEPGPISHMETTITADNAASIALFTSFARRHGAELSTGPLFESDAFPDGHDSELLYRIGPFT